MTRTATASRWLPRLLGPLLLAVILATVDLADIATAIGRASPLPIAGAGIAMLPTVPLRSWRWRVLLRAGGTNLAAVEALNAYAFSIVVGAATPGRVGELVKIGYLRHKGVATSVAIFSVGLDRLFDVVFLVLIGAGALAALVDERSALTVVGTMAAAVAATTAALAYSASAPRRQCIARSLTRYLPAKWARRVESMLGELTPLVRTMPRATVAAATLLTALTWLSTFLAVYLCAMALGFDLPFLVISGVSAIASLVALLPISVLGIGTRDAALITLLARYELSAADAVALSALFLGMGLWVVLFCAYSLATAAATTWKRTP